MGEMLEELLASRADHTFRKAFRRLVKPDLLVLDDAGFANLDRDASTDLFRLVCARYRKGSTLVVSNLPFKAWAELLPSEPQAVAIVDRLIDQASILRFSGKSFRVPRDVQGAPLEGEGAATGTAGAAGTPPTPPPAATPETADAASSTTPGASPPAPSTSAAIPVSTPGPGDDKEEGAEKGARKKKAEEEGKRVASRRSTSPKSKSAKAPRSSPTPSQPEAGEAAAEAP